MSDLGVGVRGKGPIDPGKPGWRPVDRKPAPGDPDQDAKIMGFGREEPQEESEGIAEMPIRVVPRSALDDGEGRHDAEFRACEAAAVTISISQMRGGFKRECSAALLVAPDRSC